MEAQLQRPEHDQYHHYQHAPHDTIGLYSGDEDEVMVNASQVQAEPVIPGTNLPIQADVSLEPRQDLNNNPDTRYEDEGTRRQSGQGKMEFDFEGSSKSVEPNFEVFYQSEPDPTFMEEANVAEPMVQISPLMGLEEDPHSPKSLPAKIPPSNYQSKVTDPTGHGGEEANVDPILERLDNFHIHDKSQSKPVSELKPQDDRIAPESKANLSEIPKLLKSSYPAKPESVPHDTISEKISSATSAIAGKAVSAKDMVASRLGYDGVSSNKSPVTEIATNYGHKVVETLAPVYEKVTGAGSAVMSSVQRGGGDTMVERGDGRNVSVKEYLAAKLSPGDEDKALSEAITGRFYKKEKGMAPKEEAVEEVVAHSGTERVSGGGGVVNRVKVVVRSWLGKSSGIGLSDGSVPVMKEETEVEPVHESGN